MREAVVTYSNMLIVTLDNGRPIGAVGTDDTPTTATVMASDKLKINKTRNEVNLIDLFRSYLRRA